MGGEPYYVGRPLTMVMWQSVARLRFLCGILFFPNAFGKALWYTPMILR